MNIRKQLLIENKQNHQLINVHSFVNKNNCLIIVLLLTLFIFCPAILSSQPIDMNTLNAQEEFRWGVRSFHYGYFNKAILSFEKSLSYKPDDLHTQYWLGRAYFRSGFESSALNIWRGLINSGQVSSLLDNTVKIIEQRRGLARELMQPEKYVVYHEIDAKNSDIYSFHRPSAIYFTGDYSLYLVSYADSKIIKTTANSLLTQDLSSGLESFDHPFDVLELGDYIYVSEFKADRISQCNLNGQRLKTFGGKGSGDGMLLGPQYLAADDKGYIYVTDWGNRRITKYNKQGEYILSFGQKNSAFNQIIQPTGIAIQQERVYVSDQNQNRIVLFDTSGNYLASYGTDFLQKPEGLCFFNDNLLLIADTSRIVQFDLQKEVFSVWSDIQEHGQRIVDMALSPNGEVYAVDFDLNKIFLISDTRSLYSSYFVQVLRIDAKDFPQILVDVTVEDWQGNIIMGLKNNNFLVTEFQGGIPGVSMVRANTSSAELEIVLLVEKSPQLNQYLPEIKSVVHELYNDTSVTAKFKVVSASSQPVLEADFGESELRITEATTKGQVTDNWRFDLGVRSAVSELLAGRGKKAVIFLTSGNLGSNPFSTYSISETIQYMNNNGISFYTINFSHDKLNDEIEYICQETTGKNYLYFEPKGIKGIKEHMQNQIKTTYILKYNSVSNSDFGRRYIEMAIEVMYNKKSGRDECGYFSPMEY